MNVTTLDVETSYHKKYDDTVSSPFEGDILVSVGYKVNDKPCEYLCFNHNHQKPTKDAKDHINKKFELRKPTLLNPNIFSTILLSINGEKGNKTYKNEC